MTEAELVSRKIHFYASDVGVDRETGRLLSFDLTLALRHIGNMPLAGEDRVLHLPEGRASYCWVDSDSAPQKLRLGNIRNSALPSEFFEGNLGPLPLRQRGGLADPIHVVFFENNVVGADYNFYGPRISGLQKYLAVKAHEWCHNLSLGTLVDPDTYTRLNRFQELRVLELRMRPADAEVLLESHSRGLAGTFGSANRLLDEDAQLELVLRPRAHSRGGIGSSILETVKGMFVNADVRNNMTRFRVQGINQQGETEDFIDLLSDDLTVRKNMIKQGGRSRAVDADSAYQAIIEAHDELRHKFERASRMYVLRSGDGHQD